MLSLIIAIFSVPQETSLSILNEGQAVVCESGALPSQVFRHTKGKLCWYPDPPTLESWDKTNNFVPVANCTGLFGTNMVLAPAPGSPIQCSSGNPYLHSIFTFTGSQIRRWPNVPISVELLQLDCENIVQGPDMP